MDVLSARMTWIVQNAMTSTIGNMIPPTIFANAQDIFTNITQHARNAKLDAQFVTRLTACNVLQNSIGKNKGLIANALLDITKKENYASLALLAV